MEIKTGASNVTMILYDIVLCCALIVFMLYQREVDSTSSVLKPCAVVVLNKVNTSAMLNL